jgi:hypothetical protein
MNFKLWFVLSETLDAQIKGALEQDKSPKDELAAFIKELENEPNPVDRKAAFARLRERFPPAKQKPIKQEDGQTKFYQDKLNTNQITKPEFDTFLLFKNEDKNRVTEMMNLLRRFIGNEIISLEVKNNKIYINKDKKIEEFNDFTKFESELHSIQGSLTKYEQKSGLFNPITGEKKYQKNLAAKGDNVWVFRGDTPDVCRIFGKNQRWCISSSTSASHWFDYRIRHHQTQYFVFDFNKDENDPARYVNPGVAPEGKSSEWVDAENKHSRDTEDTRSKIGINGYTSINEYKRYLASKGIPESTWTTTEPEIWEQNLKLYTDRIAFEFAKNDPDPRVFPMYLKVVDKMTDEDFNTLTDDQKKEFVLGKLQNLSNYQFDFAKNTSGYVNSLDLNSKIVFANRTENQNLISEIIKKSELSNENVLYFIKSAKNKYKIKEALGQDNIDKLTDHDVYSLLKYNSSDSTEIANILGSKNIDKLTVRYVFELLNEAPYKYKMAELLGSNNIDKLDDFEIYHLLEYAKNKHEMARILGSRNMNKLSDNSVDNLVFYQVETYQIIKILIAYKTELSANNVFACLSGKGYNDAARKEIIEILGPNNIKKLSDDHIKSLLARKIMNKDEIARILGQENIDKLDDFKSNQ